MRYEKRECIIGRLFLWDGEQYSNMFFLSEKLVDRANPLNPGDVIELSSFKLVPPTSMRIAICKFTKLDSYSYLINTVLSIQALPKPVTINAFCVYIATASCLPSVHTDNQQREKKREAPQVDWRRSLDNYTEKVPYAVINTIDL